MSTKCFVLHGRRRRRRRTTGVGGHARDRLMDSNSGSTQFMDFYIPNYILLPKSEVEEISHVPQCPVLVFINSKSGGQMGGELLKTYKILLNKNQVFDLGEEAPDKVLHKIYVSLEKLKLSGDKLATEVYNRLRLVVAGGDGTAGWLLGVVSDLKLSRPPPIATVPLGTGNNLPFSFGWGKRNPGTDWQSVKSFLDQVLHAKDIKIDSWHILMRIRSPNEGSCDPIAPLDLPRSLHAFHRVPCTDSENMEGFHTFRGGFWNYFSMGMDAQVSYAFHSERKLYPEKFKNQLVNQSTYAKLVCTQGWFCAPLFHPPSRNIAQLTKVKIMKKQGHWEDLHIPQSIRSIVCLNLPSFSGGLNPWGMPNKRTRDKDLTAPFVDDGLLEIVGFRDAWHGLVLYAPKGHGTRLAQTRGICFEFHKGAADHTYMRIDGEPWKQPLPVDDDTVVVEISHLGQVNMLATKDSRSRSINDPSTPYPQQDEESENYDEECSDDWEERRKFGAANTFKIPHEVDITKLSVGGLSSLLYLAAGILWFRWRWLYLAWMYSLGLLFPIGVIFISLLNSLGKMLTLVLGSSLRQCLFFGGFGLGLFQQVWQFSVRKEHQFRCSRSSLGTLSMEATNLQSLWWILLVCLCNVFVS